MALQEIEIELRGNDCVRDCESRPQRNLIGYIRIASEGLAAPIDYNIVLTKRPDWMLFLSLSLWH